MSKDARKILINIASACSAAWEKEDALTIESSSPFSREKASPIDCLLFFFFLHSMYVSLTFVHSFCFYDCLLITFNSTWWCKCSACPLSAWLLYAFSSIPQSTAANSPLFRSASPTAATFPLSSSKLEPIFHVSPIISFSATRYPTSPFSALS